MDRIVDYLINTQGMSERVANRNALKLCKYDDVRKEFLTFIENEEYPQKGIVIEGYSARDIHNLSARLSPVGVYNFLVSLRETPDAAKEIIAAGFPIK